MRTSSCAFRDVFDVMPPATALMTFLPSLHVPTNNRKFLSDSRICEPQPRPCSTTLATSLTNLKSSYQTGKVKTNIRVFLDQKFIAGDTLTLSASELRHLRARRARNGDVLLLFNNEGCTATALLQQSQAVVLQVAYAQPSTPAIAAIVGMPKSSSRTDWIVEKLTELGVSAITFTITARTAGTPSDAKLQRWRRLAIAASKQCLRTKIPEVSVHSFEFVLNKVEQNETPLLFCSGGSPVFSEECIAVLKKSASALLLIGPEGGFDDNEIDSLVHAGAIKVGLGNSRLRVETAAVVAAGCIGQILDRAT